MEYCSIRSALQPGTPLILRRECRGKSGDLESRSACNAMGILPPFATQPRTESQSPLTHDSPGRTHAAGLAASLGLRYAYGHGLSGYLPTLSFTIAAANHVKRITVDNMKTILSVMVLCLATATASAQTAATQDSLLSETTVKVSDHVWAILGWPNIGIVVGDKATLVVDTGLGPRNGATVAKVAKKLAPENKLYLTTTHFHPEHAMGESGFPAGTVVIRPKVQQDEMDKHGEEMIRLFSSRKDQWRELLANVKPRAADKTFDTELTLDLGGGVAARLLWFGGAHTKGDELTFVEPDKTLISGDVVQNKVVPNIYGDGSTPSSWIAVLEKVEKLGATQILPTHSAVGDGTLVAKEKAFLVDLRTRALALKEQGVDVAKAGELLTAEFKTKYADWPITTVANFVKSIYAE
jgi:glyoxylase-like metal-dependent hydrolase (beta-lactamase superfamily II)